MRLILSEWLPIIFPALNISGTDASLSGTNLTAITPGQITITLHLAATSGFNAGSLSAVFTIIAMPSITGITAELNSAISFILILRVIL